MSNITVCIAGKNQIAVEALLFLIMSGLKNRLIVCPNRTDDGRSLWQPSLIRFAKEFDIPIASLEEVQQIQELLFISLEFDRIVKPSAFRSDKLYNIHFSALPANKGMYTSALPILHGCVSSGVTLHEIDHGIDTGPIVAQKIFDIEEFWTARDLYFAYMKHGFELFCQEFTNLVANERPKAVRQRASGSTYFSKSTIDYRNISLNLLDTASGIVRQLRAFSFREYQLPKINDMVIGGWSILNERSVDKPGTILEDNARGLVFATIDYNIHVQEFTGWDWFKLKAADPVGSLDPKDVNITDSMGWTPLIRAAYAGDAALCQVLLENGADPNKTNTNGTTPLMYAYSGVDHSRCARTAKVLMKFGANPYIKDRFGRTLLDYHSSADCNECNES